MGVPLLLLDGPRLLAGRLVAPRSEEPVSRLGALVEAHPVIFIGLVCLLALATLVLIVEVDERDR